VEEQLSLGKDVILEIEIQGARKIRKQFPDAVLLFVTTKNASILRERLIGRGTETLEVIEQRLLRAVQESEGIEEYDYLVVNDDLDQCVAEIHGIIESEHRKMEHNIDLVNKVREELKGFSKGE
jgi:guanylate kinase